jgi:hypothetical protein
LLKCNLVRPQVAIGISASPSPLDEEESEAGETGETNDTSNDTCHEPTIRTSQ